MRARGRFASRDSAVAESLASGARPGSARRGWSTSSPTPTELVMIYSLVQRVGEHVIGRFQHISATQPSLVCLTADRQCDAREVAWEKQIRFLVVYAHPVEDSYQAALHRCVVKTLIEVGHQVDDCDLYAEGFQPVLSWQERQNYYNTNKNRTLVTGEINRLIACEGIVLVFPTWW